MTASVHDTATDCTYALHDDVRLTTASAIKLQVLAANLARVEDLDRPLGAQEREHAERMLWYSHNSPPTSQLYVAVGTSGMERFSEAVGASSVHHTPIYGITETNALELNLATRATLDLHATTSPLTIESRQSLASCSPTCTSPSGGASAPDCRQITRFGSRTASFRVRAVALSVVCTPGG